MALERARLQWNNPSELGAHMAVTTWGESNESRMVETTRAHVSSFMNKFRRRRFIEYDGYKGTGRIMVNKSLLKLVVQE
jgi:hypothetical protein